MIAIRLSSFLRVPLMLNVNELEAILRERPLYQGLVLAATRYGYGYGYGYAQMLKFSNAQPWKDDIINLVGH